MLDWQQLPQPIFALAPMDGVTDCVYRTMVYRHGPPDLLFTEFVSAEGLSRRAPALLQDLRFESHERPMIAQIFGYELSAFAQCIPLLGELGFDGIDINMGCPSKNVVHRGGGAALIKANDHAQKIIDTCLKALKIYFEETGKKIPLSIKTRLGYEGIAIKEWVGKLLECEGLANITLHGRTFKQSYSGEANWDAIGEAVLLAKGSGISVLGNGDIQNLHNAVRRVRETGVNGVMIGRATYGEPWFFEEKEKYRKIGATPSPLSLASESCSARSPRQRLQTLLEHAQLLAERKDPRQFTQIRKHVGWYLKHFSGASDLRKALCQINSFEEFQTVVCTSLETDFISL